MATHVFTDIETGGTEPHHPIVQIGAVAMRDGSVVGEFERKIQFNPDLCDPQALLIIGYSPERWMCAEPAVKVAKDFAAFLNKYKSVQMISKNSGNPYKVARIAGYNSAAFDMPRLLKWFKDLDVFMPAHPQSLDVLQLVGWLAEIDPVGMSKLESRKLKDVSEFFGISLENAHDALSDCMATALVAQAAGQALYGFVERKLLSEAVV